MMTVLSVMMVMLTMSFLTEQNDDSSGPNIDLAPGPLQDKKMEAEKRGMGMNDFNGDLRKGGRGGGVAYRPPGSKEAAPVEAGSYYDKVTTPCCLSKPLSNRSFLCLNNILSLSLFFISSCDSILSSSSPFLLASTLLFHPSSPLKLVFPWLSLTDLAFDQSGWVPWGGGSLLFVLTTHCLQAPFSLQPHYSL